MNHTVVSDEQRRDNFRVVEERNRWRRRYKDTALAIRRAKSRLRDATQHGNIAGERAERATIEALGLVAYMMMASREGITQDLRRTAYRYAPKEALECLAS